jgi:hypothetical protein
VSERNIGHIPVGAGTSWRLFTYAFQGCFLPGTPSTGVRLLPDSDARAKRQEEADLIVGTEHVVQLTDQCAGSCPGEVGAILPLRR